MTRRKTPSTPESRIPPLNALKGADKLLAANPKPHNAASARFRIS